MAIVLKITSPDQAWRFGIAPVSTTFKDFRSAIQPNLKTALRNSKLVYIDDEGDRCTICSDATLHAALNSAVAASEHGDSPKILRLYLAPGGPTDKTGDPAKEKLETETSDDTTSSSASDSEESDDIGSRRRRCRRWRLRRGSGRSRGCGGFRAHGPRGPHGPERTTTTIVHDYGHATGHDHATGHGHGGPGRWHGRGRHHHGHNHGRKHHHHRKHHDISSSASEDEEHHGRRAMMHKKKIISKVAAALEIPMKAAQVLMRKARNGDDEARATLVHAVPMMRGGPGMKLAVALSLPLRAARQLVRAALHGDDDAMATVANVLPHFTKWHGCKKSGGGGGCWKQMKGKAPRWKKKGVAAMQAWASKRRAHLASKLARGHFTQEKYERKIAKLEAKLGAKAAWIAKHCAPAKEANGATATEMSLNLAALKAAAGVTPAPTAEAVTVVCAAFADAVPVAEVVELELAADGGASPTTRTDKKKNKNKSKGKKSSGLASRPNLVRALAVLTDATATTVDDGRPDEAALIAARALISAAEAGDSDAAATLRPLVNELPCGAPARLALGLGVALPVARTLMQSARRGDAAAIAKVNVVLPSFGVKMAAKLARKVAARAAKEKTALTKRSTKLARKFEKGKIDAADFAAKMSEVEAALASLEVSSSEESSGAPSSTSESSSTDSSDGDE